MFSHRIDDDLTLRLLEPHHADELYAAVDANRAHLREWLPWVDDSKSSADTLAFINRNLARLARNDGFQVGIWERGRILGAVGHLYVNHLSRKTEIGYWLAADGCGRGVMTRAVIAMTDHAFDEYKLNRMEIHCAVGNAPSRAMPERLGFQQEGVLRQAGWLYDHFVDHVIYGILAS